MRLTLRGRCPKCGRPLDIRVRGLIVVGEACYRDALHRRVWLPPFHLLTQRVRVRWQPPPRAR